MRPPIVLMLIGAAIVIAAVAGGLLWSPARNGRADPGDAAQVALGKEVYLQRCASCHGARLEGQPDWRIRKPDGRLPAPPHDENGHTWHHPDEQLFRLTKLGLKPPLAPAGYQSDMPAFGSDLSDDRIWAVLAFIKSRWPAEIQARRNRIGQGATQ